MEWFSKFIKDVLAFWNNKIGSASKNSIDFGKDAVLQYFKDRRYTIERTNLMNTVPDLIGIKIFNENTKFVYIQIILIQAKYNENEYIHDISNAETNGLHKFAELIRKKFNSSTDIPSELRNIDLFITYGWASYHKREHNVSYMKGGFKGIFNPEHSVYGPVYKMQIQTNLIQTHNISNPYKYPHNY